MHAAFANLSKVGNTPHVCISFGPDHDLQRISREQHQPICSNVIRRIIKEAGYKWRRARVVLTSKDLDYRTKVDAIKKILSELREDEAFFSVDEYGPFAVKQKGRSILLDKA